ncbi:MAG: NAD-binding protein [Acidimicrobiales bacterium]|nr:NAD-binding protein [Acidimicrobiales bacterium]MCB1015989.1 NAD-binding protein [Acidimicrobiales bacterium]
MLDLQVSRREWVFRAVVAGVVVVVLALTWFGAGAYLDDRGVPWDVADRLYLTIQTFTLQLSSLPDGVAYPPALQVARFLAPLTLASGTLLALVGLFGESRNRIRSRWFIEGHAVVCGLGAIGSEALRALRREGWTVVGLDWPDASGVTGAREERAVVIVGDARDPAVWRQAGVSRAARVLVACGDDQTNGEAAMAACASIGTRRGGPPVPVQVHLEDRNLVARHAFERAGSPGGPGPVEPRTFNLNESAANRLLALHLPFSLDPDRPPRVVVVGTCHLARALVVQVARFWSLARRRRFPEEALTLVWLDPDAPTAAAELQERIPDLEGLLAIEVRADHLHAADLAKRLAIGDRDERIYVCLEDEAEGLAVALGLGDERNGEFRPAQPIVVQARVTRGTTHFALGLDLEGTTGSDAPPDHLQFATLRGGVRIATFAPLEVACEPLTLFGDRVQQQARLAHDVYRGQRALEPEDGRDPETDPSLLPWSRLDADDRSENLAQVEFMHAIWECVGVRGDPVPFDGVLVPAPVGADELERLARREHQRWSRKKRRDGVRRGPERTGSTHPDIRPYGRLDEAARKKDRVAVLGYVQGLAGLGLRLPDRQDRGRLGSPDWATRAAVAGAAAVGGEPEGGPAGAVDQSV